MTNICNVNGFSNYGFINGEAINVSDYIKNNNTQKITCLKGHKLILVNGEKRKPHFRHKYSADVGGNPMSLWHCEWQSNFPITEKSYSKIPKQLKERRADVVLNETQILEIQHSEYKKEEIDNRKHDYQLHNIDIIWLIDGNANIDVKILEYSNRVYLEFMTDYWKYESFKSYNYIFIDINSIIYKIHPNKVKSHMIDVENGKTKEEFILSLKNNINIWNDEEPEQCNLFIKQQGAGNGKTFGIIKMIEDDDKCHYTNFIYITKQHSAKHIIKTEFENQKHNFQHLKNIEIIESNKKYIIHYFNEKSKRNCQIIVSTIDSFTYSIGNKNHSHFEKFEGLIYSIIDGHIETKNCGTINFAGINPKLNKETLLVIDEFQDPPEHYAKAIVQIMRNKYIDVFIVGDKLQSITYEKNAFTYFLEHEFPLIKINKLEPTNICRRFIHPKLVEFVNCMIPFEKYGLPKINPYEEYNGADASPLIFFTGNFTDSTVKTDENEDKIIKEVEKIMEYYENEVYENTRFPEDFLVVTPFTTQNPLVDALLLSINMFWKNKFTNEPEYMALWKNDITTDEYYRYAIFHKSEKGSSIDLSESECSTRIVSCHASKGDGRKVVFIIGFNECAIQKFSQTSNNLVYDSLFHVGITRMKEKLYVRYYNNNDDIARKINKYRQTYNNDSNCKEVKPDFDISKCIKYDKLVSNSIDKSYELFVENIINVRDVEPIIENQYDKRIIDMGNHIIRYSSLYINILLEIVKKEKMIVDSKIKKQIIAILNKVCESDITPVNDMRGYYKLLSGDKEIPIIRISNKGKDHITYFNAIIDITNILKVKVKRLLQNNEDLNLCPLECIILNYMIEISHRKEYSTINIVDIYDIIDLYSNAFDHNSLTGHESCLCNKHFNKCCITEVKNKKIDNMKLYLLTHFEKINNIKIIMKLFHNKYPEINWLINHEIYYEGNSNFKVTKRFNLIGYDENNVIIVYLKPQFNSLNYNETLVNSIFDTHFLNNVKKYDEKEKCKLSHNYNRFNGKHIITCVFTLDRNEPYYVDVCSAIKNNVELIKNRICVNIIEKYKLETSNLHYFYTYWRKFCPNDDNKPSDFMRFLKEKLEEKQNIPNYVNDYFSQIECEIKISKSKQNKEQILINNDDIVYFTENIEKELNVNVKRYLAIKIDDDEDDY